MSNWIVVDWAYNRIFPTKEFESFEDAWGYIREKFPDEEDWQEYEVIEKDHYDEFGKRYLDPNDPRSGTRLAKKKNPERVTTKTVDMIWFAAFITSAILLLKAISKKDSSVPAPQTSVTAGVRG